MSMNTTVNEADIQLGGGRNAMGKTETSKYLITHCIKQREEKVEYCDSE